MRTRVAFLSALTLCLVLAGCSGSSTAPTAGPGTTSSSAPAGKSLVGKWKGQIDAPKGTAKDDPSAKMAEAFASMFGDMELEIKEGDRFGFTVLGITSEGPITHEGDKMTLTPEKIMGKTVEEFKKMNEASGKSNADAGKPMSATVSADGETITLFDSAKPDQSMTFKRSTDKPRAIGASTVTADETPLVGHYGAEMDATKVSEKDRAMTEAMMSTAKLSLDVDNTFSMTMMLTLEGTWKLDGGKVVLTITKALGMPDSGSKQKPIVLTVEGDKLVPQADDKEAPPVKFVKQK